MNPANQGQNLNQRAQLPQTSDKNSWFGVWWKAIAVLAGALFLGLGSLGAFWLLARPLGILILGSAIAAALEPVIAWLSRRMQRSIAVIIIYVLGVLILALLGWVIIPNLTAQVQQFLGDIPTYTDNLNQFFNERGWLPDQAPIDALFGQLQQAGTQLLSAPITLFSTLLEFILIFVIALYLLLQAKGIERTALSLFPSPRREQIQQVAHEMLQAAGGFVRGIVLDGVIVGVITYIGLSLIGVSFPLVLALVAGVLETLPVIGTIIATLIVVGVSLLDSPTTALITLVFFVILQQLEGNFLVPNVMHGQAHVSPVIVVIVIFAGGAIGGWLGALAAIPLTAALRVFFLRVIAPWIRQQTGAPNPKDQ